MTETSSAADRVLPPAAYSMRVAATYCVAAVLWIFVSNAIVGEMVSSVAQLARIEVLKDIALVLVTTLLLFLMIRRHIASVVRLRADLDRSSNQYQKLFDGSPVPMWVYDPSNYAFLAVNDAAVQSYGYSRDEFLRMTLRDIRPHEQVSSLERFLADLRNAPASSRSGVWQHRRKDGEIIDVAIASHVVEFEGRAARVVLAQDVTEQRRAVAAVAESEERLRLALTAASQGLFDLDVQTGIAVVNPEYARMLGHDPAEFRETTAAWIGRMHPDDRAAGLAIFQDYLAGRIPEYRVEFRQRTRDGRWKWIRSLGRVVERDGEGRPARMLGTHTDIDREKQAQARIERLTSLYSALSQTGQAIVRAADPQVLYREVCRIAVEQGHLRMAWIGVPDLERGEVVPVAGFGERQDYAERIRVRLDPAHPDGRGPMSLALREGRHYVCNDFAQDEATRPWREAAREAGFQASAAFPLLCEGAVIGALNLYADQPGYFDADIVALLDQMAADLGFALDRFALAERRALAESLLQESESRFRHLLASLDDVVWSATLDNQRMLYISEAAQRVYGWPMEAFFADPQIWLRAALPADREHVRLSFDALSSVGHAECEYRIVRSDGEIRWLHERRSIIRDEAGAASRIAGTASDVTARKHAEEALRASEEQFRALASVSPVGVFRTDARGACLYVNRKWCEIAGLEEEQARGRGWERALHPDDSRAVTEGWYAAAVRGGSYLMECRFRRPDGTETWVIAQATPERDARGNVIGYVGCIIDISERKAAEQYLRAGAQRLEALSRRMLQLQEDERRALARELHDEVGQQLTALRLNLDALRRTLGDGPSQTRLADCAEIVDTTIAQIRDRALDLRPAVLDDLGLKAALDSYGRRQALRSGCRIEVKVSPPPSDVTGELQTALFRIAQESVNNALRHGCAKHIDIAVSFEDGCSVLAVRDDGAGFDVAQVMMRADSGPGIGLPGMRERAELLGGSLEVRSAPGAGAEVLARIPLEA